MNRHFYRCTGCLEVVAIDGDRLPMEYGRTLAKCEICHQTFEYMGRVERDRLVTDRTVCKCDDRCTSARGPLCVCACGGKNHGAGLMGYMVVTEDAGKVPTIRLRNLDRIGKARRQFEEFVTLRDQLRARFMPLVDRRAAGERLPREQWDELNRLQRAYRDACDARAHHSRMKTLRTVLPDASPIRDFAAELRARLAANPIAEVPFSLTSTIDSRKAKQTSLF